MKIQNIGITKFDGTTIEELDRTIDDLYINQDVAYVILVGDDLPVARSGRESFATLLAINERLELVGRDFRFSETGQSNMCRDLGISYILPPLRFENNEKIAFIKNVLEKYVAYHANPEYYFSQYRKALLSVQWDQRATDLGLGTALEPFLDYSYVVPKVIVSNANHQEVQSRFREKFLFLRYDVHGSRDLIGLGLNYQNLPADDYFAYLTTLEEYSSFVEEFGQLSLFVDAGACQASSIEFEDRRFCCWPQIMLQSGVWAYYELTGVVGARSIIKDFTGSGIPLGLAIRRNHHDQNIIFGDILAHSPSQITVSSSPTPTPTPVRVCTTDSECGEGMRCLLPVCANPDPEQICREAPDKAKCFANVEQKARQRCAGRCKLL